MIDEKNTPVSEPVKRDIDDSGKASTIVETRDSLFSNGFTFWELSMWLAFGMPILCLILAIIEGSSYIWRPIAIFLYALLSLFSILFIGVVNLPSKSKDKIDNDEIDFVATLLGSIAVLVGFSQLSRHLSFLASGFIFQETGYWHWLRFGFSNLLESMLFDIPAIYGWNLSEIQATSMWSRTITFIFRTSIEFLVVAVILRQTKTAWKNRQNTSRNSANNYFSLIFPKAGELILIIMWGVPLAIGIGAIVNDGLSLESTWSVIRLGAPVFLGVWLAWHSLRGLGLSGFWNKLFALLGVISGSWLVREYWSALRAFIGQ